MIEMIGDIHVNTTIVQITSFLQCMYAFSIKKGPKLLPDFTEEIIHIIFSRPRLLLPFLTVHSGSILFICVLSEDNKIIYMYTFTVQQM